MGYSCGEDWTRFDKISTIYDEHTVNTVKALQRDHGLEVTGRENSATRKIFEEHEIVVLVHTIYGEDEFSWKAIAQVIKSRVDDGRVKADYIGSIGNKGRWGNELIGGNYES